MSKEPAIKVAMIANKDGTTLSEEGYRLALQNRDYQIWSAEAMSARLSGRSVRMLEFTTRDGVVIHDYGSRFEVHIANEMDTASAMRAAWFLLTVKGWAEVDARAPGLGQDQKQFLGVTIMRSGITMNAGRMQPDRKLLEFSSNWRLPHWMRGDIRDDIREAWLSNMESLYDHHNGAYGARVGLTATPR